MRHRPNYGDATPEDLARALLRPLRRPSERDPMHQQREEEVANSDAEHGAPGGWDPFENQDREPPTGS